MNIRECCNKYVSCVIRGQAAVCYVLATAIFDFRRKRGLRKIEAGEVAA